MSKDNVLSPVGGKLVGIVRTLNLRLPVELVGTNATDPNKPAFTVYSNGLKLGAAWEKRAKDTNEPFYSITIDDVSFDKPLNLTAFKRGDNGDFEMVWSRPRPKAEAA